MTTKELVQIFDDVIAGAEVNRNNVTPQLLDNIEEIVLKLKAEKQLNEVICLFLKKSQNEIDEIFNFVEKAIKSERDILTRGVDTRMVNLLKTLKNRPIILASIAMLV